MPEMSWVFGQCKSGETVNAYKLKNNLGAYAVVLDYGATVQSLLVPNAHGGLTDVVLGYETVNEYEEHDAYLGATVGRMANRVGRGEFSLGGKTYKLAINNGPNSLHGGIKGFDSYVWRAMRLGDNSVRFSRLSPDGEENYPGNLNVSVTYTLDDECALRIDYDAISDADTIVNLTNHSYFDLSGCGKGMEQELKINACSYLESDENTLPTGKILCVDDSPFDFRQFKAIGRDIDAHNEQLRLCHGYDHCYCLSQPLAAELRSYETGIRMEVLTDLPGMQLYTSNFLTDRAGKAGSRMGLRCAVALETQLYPNALNCYAFPSPILRKGQAMHHCTKYRFSLI